MPNAREKKIKSKLFLTQIKPKIRIEIKNVNSIYSRLRVVCTRVETKTLGYVNKLTGRKKGTNGNKIRFEIKRARFIMMLKNFKKIGYSFNYLYLYREICTMPTIVLSLATEQKKSFSWANDAIVTEIDSNYMSACLFT